MDINVEYLHLSLLKNSIKMQMRVADFFLRLKKEGLRDNMTNLELVLNMLAEVTTKEISKKENPADFTESLEVAKKGGGIAGNTRKEIESITGKPVVSEDNFLEMPEKLKKKKKMLTAYVG